MGRGTSHELLVPEDGAELSGGVGHRELEAAQLKERPDIGLREIGGRGISPCDLFLHIDIFWQKKVLDILQKKYIIKTTIGK